MAWQEILAESRLPPLTSFSTHLDMTEMAIQEPGKLSLEQTITILDQIDGLDQYSAIVLPEGFLYRIDARTVRKNVRPIRLRRFVTRKEAIEQKATPEQLIRERIEQMRSRYQRDTQTLVEPFGGINYRGITDRKTKNYLISDAIEGYLHAQDAGQLIEVSRYDTLEELLKFRSREIPASARTAIRRELMKVRRRETMTDKLKKVPESVRRVLLTKQAERIVSVPSTSEEGKFYKIRFRRLPLAFPDNLFPELNHEYHASWTDTYTEPSCNCDNKTWFITYLRPGQIWQCVHEIAAFRAMIQRDWKRSKPVTFPNPYIAASPFFKPTQDAIDFYRKLRRQVFVTKHGRYEHLPDVYVDILLEKQVRRGKLELL